MSEYIVATYKVSDPKGNFSKKAETIAIGMTVGSWTDLPQARKEELRQHLGHVVSVTEHPVTGDDMPTATIQIAYPQINFSKDIPALLTTVFGKLSMDGRIKLMDLQFSKSFLNAFPGPKYGLKGVRDLLGVYDRPLLMSIFKSCIGQDLSSLEEQFYQQALGGVDIVKDDEILFENPLSPFEKRLEAGLRAANRAERETGQKTLYALNLTGPSTQILEKARKAVQLGANALLFNVLPYGFDLLHRLSEDPEIQVPIMAHPAFAGAMYPAQHYGIASPLLLGKLMRVAGADFVLFPSPYGSVAMEREDTLLISAYLREECQAETHQLKASFPVPSAGIHPGIAPLLYDDFGIESIMNAGGGIHGHPGGPRDGGRAFRQAIDLLTTGSDFEQEYSYYPELKAAIEDWGLIDRLRGRA